MELQQLEDVRKVYAKKLKIVITLALTVLFLSIFLASASYITFFDNLTHTLGYAPILGFVIIILSIPLIIVSIFAYQDSKDYKKLYKSYFVERSLKQVFTDIHYDHTQGMPIEALRQTDMIRTGDVYESDDFFAGKYHDVALSQADVHILIRQESDDTTSYSTIFKGRWMVFEFPKKFNFRLQVVSKHFAARKKPSKDPNTKRSFERISTESPTFDRKFKVYAEDGFEAYYILDPAFIDHIEKLSSAHKGKLLLCFIDNKLSVAIDDRNNAFEAPNPLKPIDEAKEIAKVSQEIKTITDFVDFLKLDHKLFQGDKGAK